MRSLHGLCILQAFGLGAAAFQSFSNQPSTAQTQLSYSASTEVDFLKRIQRLTQERDGKILPSTEKRKRPKKIAVKAVSAPSLTTDSWLTKFIEGTSINSKPFEDVWDKFTFQPAALACEGDWSAYWDEFGSGYVYFFNEVTGESQWDRPTLSFPKIDMKDGMKIVEMKKASDEENDFSVPLASKGEWNAYFDGDKSQRVYYHNSFTGVSQWEKPTKDFPSFTLTPAMKKYMRRNKADFDVASAFVEISKIAGTWLRRFELKVDAVTSFTEAPAFLEEKQSKKEPSNVFSVVADSFSRYPLFGNAKTERNSEPSWNFLEQCMTFFGKK